MQRRACFHIIVNKEIRPSVYVMKRRNLLLLLLLFPMRYDGMCCVHQLQANISINGWIENNYQHQIQKSICILVIVLFTIPTC